MLLNKKKFVTALSRAKDPSFTKKRSWDKIYNFKTSSYWNNILWDEILKDKAIKGEGIDRFEFFNFCDHIINIDSINKIFNSINFKSKCILIEEFENYLEKLDEIDYVNIIDSLEKLELECELEVELEAELEPELEVELEVELEPEILKSEEIRIVPDLIKNDSLNDYYLSKTPPTSPSSEYSENESSFFKRLFKRVKSLFG